MYLENLILILIGWKLVPFLLNQYHQPLNIQMKRANLRFVQVVEFDFIENLPKNANLYLLRIDDFCEGKDHTPNNLNELPPLDDTEVSRQNKSNTIYFIKTNWGEINKKHT